MPAKHSYTEGPARPVRSRVIVVGAGPAGLAVAACLKRAGVPFIQLEQARQVGMSWRQHYDRLHLHTSKGISALPFLPFPRSYPPYPSRDQVVAYLEHYARHFRLRPRFGQEVRSAARRRGGGWEVHTQDTRYHADILVVATGYAREPARPRWPGQSVFEGEVIHSARYRNGSPFAGRRVLVVGFGNSGGEIALDLCECGAAECALSVRSPVNVIPRDLLGLPVVSLGLLFERLPARITDTLMAPVLRLVIGDLSSYGLKKLPYGPMTQIRENGRVPLIDVGTMRLIREGTVRVYPDLERFTPTGVVFADGREQAFDAVILATGYRPAVHAFLEVDGALDAQGVPVCSGGETAAPGLYFCGYNVGPGGVLREIRREAKAIVRGIAM